MVDLDWDPLAGQRLNQRISYHWSTNQLIPYIDIIYYITTIIITRYDIYMMKPTSESHTETARSLRDGCLRCVQWRCQTTVVCVMKDRFVGSMLRIARAGRYYIDVVEYNNQFRQAAAGKYVSYLSSRLLTSLLYCSTIVWQFVLLLLVVGK